MKTLNERVIEAKMLASLSKIESRDKHGRVKTVLVPGSQATLNHVTIRRHNDGVIATECRKLGRAGYADCLGNMHGVCRHSLAAIFVALAEQGYMPRFRRNYSDAEKLSIKCWNTPLLDKDGVPMVWTLASHQGKHARVYFVAIEDPTVELTEHNNLSWHGVPPEEIVLASGSSMDV